MVRSINDISKILNKYGYDEYLPNTSYQVYLKEENDYVKTVVLVRNLNKEYIEDNDNLDSIHNKIKFNPYFNHDKEYKILTVIISNSKKDKVRLKGDNLIFFTLDGKHTYTNCDSSFDEEFREIYFERSVKESEIALENANSNKFSDKCEITYITYLLAGLCAFIFLSNLNLEQYALSTDGVIKEHKYYTLITYMFMHNGKIHFLSNMITLILFGSALEKKMGHIRYILFTIISGVYAGLFTIFISIANDTTYEMTVGLSGSLYAMMTAVCIISMLKRSKITILFSIYLFGQIALSFRPREGVDNVAHIGGAFIGLLLTLIYMCAEQIRFNNTLNRFYKKKLEARKRKH